MQSFCAFLLVLPLGAAVQLADSSTAGSAVSVSPVQQVLTLLTDLEAKIKADGAKEEDAYRSFQDWCRGGYKDKEFEIKTAKANIETLSATITKAETDLASGSSSIEELAGAISGNEADLKAATELREKERADFEAAEAELVDVLDTLDRAINLLERKLRGSMLMQQKVNTQDVGKVLQMLGTIIDSASLSLHDKKRLMSLAQNRAAMDEDEADSEGEGDEDDMGAPEPDAYKSHSESIIDVLEDMRAKADAQLNELRREEVNAKHSYELTKQSVDDQIAADTKDMAETKAAAAAAAEAKATAEGDLEVTKRDLADAEKTMAQMQTSCTTAAADHEASVKSREEELQALAEAKKAITDSVTGAASATYGASFVQLDEDLVGSNAAGTKSKLTTHIDLANFEVVNIIRRLAKQDRSVELSELASRVAAAIKYGGGGGADPFAKVKALIADMIDRLQKEAGVEANHKVYCDREMAGTQEKIDDLTTNLDQLRAKVDKKKALSVDLKNEIQELQAEVVEIHRSQKALDDVRAQEHTSFVEMKVSLETGLNGVRRALQILREYYAQDSAPSLLQQPAVPQYHSKSSGAGSGVVALLEVVESDFGKALAQEEMVEDTAATEYQKISMQNKVSLATKEADVKYKTREAAELDKSVAELSSDGDSTQTELDAVLDYSKSIRGQCVAQPMTYEERTARRQEEIDGLKEALQILEGQGMLLQRRKRGGRLSTQGLRGSSIRRHVASAA